MLVSDTRVLTSGPKSVGGHLTVSLGLASHLSLSTRYLVPQGDLARERYGTLTGTISKLMAEGGVGQFFRGWTWRAGRTVCSVFIIGEVKNILVKGLGWETADPAVIV